MIKTIQFDSPVNKIKNQKFAHLSDLKTNRILEGSETVISEYDGKYFILIKVKDVIYSDKLPPETRHKRAPLLIQPYYKALFNSMLKFGIINRRDTLEKHLEAIDEAVKTSVKRKAVGLLGLRARETGLVFTEEQIEYLDGVFGGEKWKI